MNILTMFGNFRWFANLMLPLFFPPLSQFHNIFFLRIRNSYLNCAPSIVIPDSVNNYSTSLYCAYVYLQQYPAMHQRPDIQLDLVVDQNVTMMHQRRILGYLYIYLYNSGSRLKTHNRSSIVRRPGLS